ncbi:MAG: hypothetical protein ACOX4O_05405 [Eubacteriales bacterium]|jgi:hypothetical protein
MDNKNNRIILIIVIIVMIGFIYGIHEIAEAIRYHGEVIQAGLMQMM